MNDLIITPRLILKPGSGNSKDTEYADHRDILVKGGGHRGEDVRIGEIYIENGWGEFSQMFIFLDSHRGNGYGSEALKAYLPHMSDKMRNEKIGIVILPHNMYLVNFYEKHGFQLDNIFDDSRHYIFDREKFNSINRLSYGDSRKLNKLNNNPNIISGIIN